MSEPIVNLQEGKIKGVIGENSDGKPIYRFLGVPYAKPPVGPLRFKAPEPVEPWNGVKDATKDGNASIQRAIELDPPIVIGDENCLVLNVATKQIGETKDLKPVMFYIHGGGFTSGSNRSDWFGPEFLLTEDIVFVCVNYRLGILGFLSLEDESLNVPGNAGLKDQILALKWVQRNIKVFGGDPNNVTIFGESAGAGSVHLLVLSSAAKGLFHKAIPQSGTALGPWAIVSSTGPLIAKVLDKSGASDREIYGILKDMSGKQLFELQEKLPDEVLYGTQRPLGPVVEKPNPTAVITKSPMDIIISGQYNQIPLLFGYTSNEGIMLEFFDNLIPNYSNQYTYEKAIPWYMNLNKEKRDNFVEIASNFYSKIKSPLNRQLLCTDAIFLSQIASAAIHHSRTSKSPVYVFRVSAESKRNWVKQVFYDLHKFEGVSHGDELGYVFAIKELGKLEKNTLEHSLVHQFVKIWTNFAKFGNPTPNKDLGIILAPVKGADKIPVLDIGNKLTVSNDLPERDRIEIWKKLYSLSVKTANYLS